MSSQINELWQHLALEIGEGVYHTVNTPDMVGTDDETGYALMFFNKKNHGGKSTFISSMTDPDQIEKLLNGALKELRGKNVKIFEPCSGTIN